MIVLEFDVSPVTECWVCLHSFAYTRAFMEHGIMACMARVPAEFGMVCLMG